MPPEQKLECGLVVVGDESFEQLGVGRTGVAVRHGHAVQVADDGLQRNAGHVLARGDG
ncbi:MAG TPA: hypothetical protein VL371_17095 [Gemmataceae bacterium]|nr:hypothetical protein [Gemmataceae bacterium]